MDDLPRDPGTSTADAAALISHQERVEGQLAEVRAAVDGYGVSALKATPEGQRCSTRIRSSSSRSRWSPLLTATTGWAGRSWRRSVPARCRGRRPMSRSACGSPPRGSTKGRRCSRSVLPAGFSRSIPGSSRCTTRCRGRRTPSVNSRNMSGRCSSSDGEPARCSRSRPPVVCWTPRSSRQRRVGAGRPGHDGAAEPDLAEGRGDAGRGLGAGGDRVAGLPGLVALRGGTSHPEQWVTTALCAPAAGAAIDTLGVRRDGGDREAGGQLGLLCNEITRRDLLKRVHAALADVPARKN